MKSALVYLCQTSRIPSFKNYYQLWVVKSATVEGGVTERSTPRCSQLACGLRSPSMCNPRMRISQNLNYPVLFLYVIISDLTVCCFFSYCTVMLFLSEHSRVFPVMIWPFLFPFSSPLFSSPLLTFDLSDLETSVDSRCTTDSADSAFIGRRYWFPASFLPFLSSHHPLPPPSTQEERVQIRL